MQIVIGIDDKLYNRIKYLEPKADTMLDELMRSVQNGTPLPKGHGDLKDADVMKNKLCTHEASELFGSTTCAEILDFINDEKPIIEADREVRDGNNKI